jgi:hypothetical protein
MPLPSPNLDDRTFDQLVEEARGRIQQSCPEWTDLSPGDPGMVLLELFAHLTETMIYRLNRLPEKAYVEFLRLIGVRIQPPAAASVMLRFTRGRAGEQPVEIPRGTRVTVNRPDSGSEPPVFVTARTVTLPAGETQVEVLAHHCEPVEAELAGVGTGLPGLVIQAQRPPIVAPTGAPGDEFDLLVGVEATPEELDERAPVIQREGKAYRLWREVDYFANLGLDRFVYVADRMAGTITFAPAARMQGADESPTKRGTLEEAPRALAAIPAPGREIRLWYWRGGGPEGNVAAGTLTVLKDPIPGLEVTNPAPASGGEAAETLQNALVRGPQELHSLQRAVTARDFELLALNSSRAVARATALTRADMWTYASPGTVEVLLVPDLPQQERGAGQVTAAALQARETDTVRSQIQHALDERRPLGTTSVANWTRYKVVRVGARIVVRRQEDQAAVRQRVVERLHQTINPLPTPLNPAGWPFGQALRASHVYDIALKEPGVLWVDQVRLLVQEVPDKEVSIIAADASQPHTWYAGSGETLFRSLDDGEGWETAGQFPGEQIQVVRSHPERAGLVAVATQVGNGGGSRIHISADCAESWPGTPYATAFEINDVAWILRDGVPALLLATDVGLYELVLRPDGSPVQVLVDRQDQDRGFYAVAALKDVAGRMGVAVAAQATAGVYFSSAGGQSDTFQHVGLKDEDVRVLAVQYDGPRTFLWAGAAAAGGDAGHGCFRSEWSDLREGAQGWQPFSNGWAGGSCRAIAFVSDFILAASHHAGVLRLPSGRSDAAWETPDVRCGLPLRDPGRFHPVDAVAARPGGNMIMAGGLEGVFRSQDGGVHYASSSSQEFLDKVTLPPTWLFCSGEHEVVVVSEDEAEPD